MTDKPPARPRQVTLSGSLIMGGSVLVVLFAFQQVSQLGSIEAQESAARYISGSPVDGLGLSVDDVQAILRVMAVVAGGCAAAAAILGWQVMQRSRSARLALTVIAPVLLIAGLAPAGFASALVAAAVTMLWTQPARDWFAGVAPASRRPGPDPFAVAAPVAGPTSGPPDVSAPGAAPQEQPADAAPPRPGAVLVAGLLAIGASVLTLVASALALVYALSAREDYLDFVDEAVGGQALPDGVAVADIADVLIAVLVMVVVWCVVAIGLAALAMRGSNGARITLVVSAGGAALVSLLGILSVLPLLLTAAAVATMVLLLRGDVSRWYAARAPRLTPGGPRPPAASSPPR